jgi:hypothetical protein
MVISEGHRGRPARVRGLDAQGIFAGFPRGDPRRRLVLSRSRARTGCSPPTVQVIDTPTNQVLTTSYLGRARHEGFFCPDDRYVWVAVRGLDYAAVLDWRNCKVSRPRATRRRCAAELPWLRPVELADLFAAARQPLHPRRERSADSCTERLICTSDCANSNSV